jgi:SAM-dependent methyltransferase
VAIQVVLDVSPDTSEPSWHSIKYARDQLKDHLDRSAATFAAAFKDRPNVHFAQMDAARLGWRAANFDTISLANSLHHLSDPSQILTGLNRVLKPGGQFIISEMYRDGQTEEQQTHVLLHHWWAAVDTAQGVTHHETYTREQLIAMIEALNLRSLTFIDVCDPSGDPKDPEMIMELASIIDRYIERATGLPEAAMLQQRGEQLRQRVQTIGFQSATTLIAVGEKLTSAVR